MIADEARKCIEAKGIVIKDCVVYNIYACGCIYKREDDPQRLMYFPATKSSNRSCPVCDHSAIVVKYKICQCGKEHCGSNVMQSKFCTFCANDRRAKDLKENPKTGPTFKELRNKSERDPNRWGCVHREKCFKKYIKYDAIPCKDCKDYQIGGANADPLTVSNNPMNSIL